MNQKQKYYPWVIMLTACIYVGAIIGVGTNCASIFIPVMAKEFGVGLGAVSTLITVMCVSMAVCSPWVGRVIDKIDIRIFMIASALLTGISFGVQAMSKNLLQLYLSGVVLGVGVSMGSFMTVTVLINNWFVKNRGMVIGITLSISSIVGIIVNPILNTIIETKNWQTASLLKGILILLTIPMVWLLVRSKPSDLGLTAYGEEAEHTDLHQEATAAKQDTGKAFISAPFLMMLLFSFVFTVCLNHATHMQSIAASAGFSSNVGAMMISAYMVGEFVGKLSLGWLNDKYGINRAVNLVVAIGLVGVIGLFLAPKLGEGFGLASALLFGPMTSVTSVGLTLIINNTFGPKLYPRYYPYMNIASTIAFSVGASVIGFMYDFTGSWNLSYAVVFLGLSLSLLLLNASTKMMNKAQN